MHGSRKVSAVMWDGYEALGKLISGRRRFMQRKGYNSIEDFRGTALPHIKRENCNGCGLCQEVCPRQALILEY